MFESRSIPFRCATCANWLRNSVPQAKQDLPSHQGHPSSYKAGGLNNSLGFSMLGGFAEDEEYDAPRLSSTSSDWILGRIKAMTVSTAHCDGILVRFLAMSARIMRGKIVIGPRYTIIYDEECAISRAHVHACTPFLNVHLQVFTHCTQKFRGRGREGVPGIRYGCQWI